MDARSYQVGECKYIDWHIQSNRAHDCVVVTAAAWVLYDKATGDKVEEGVCEISRDVVSALLQPSAAGKYLLTATVTVPPETFIVEVDIYVH